ncbi:hypothetical protein C0Q70_20254 [Pomacea canaliculata]|uniref:CSD domain-containing protein n=1 Tax=Pomacea canaliculata TaxID=400727 RepID=A0A2T7NF05_POMCA|nr:hypothetical protein C0Q70_20254 [Pomacea canaliculata]
MDSWDCVQTEFMGDETTNFGPRIENGTALYQVDTLATISPKSQTASEVTSLVTAAVGELACVGVNQHLSVFQDSQLQITIAFESTLEDAAWSPDGSLLVTVDSTGKLYIFIAETLQSVFSHRLLPCERITSRRAFQNICFHRCDNGLCDLILLSSSGLLFVVKDLDTKSLTQETDNIASIIQQQLQFATVETHQMHTRQACDIVSLGHGNIITVGCGDCVLAVWEWHENSLELVDSIGSILDKDAGIVHAHAVSNNKLLLTLDENSQISIWCVPELVLLLIVVAASETKHIENFVLLETPNNTGNSLRGMRLVLCEKNREDLGDNACLKILTLPEGECIYSLQTGHPVCMPRCGLTEESLLLAEGSPEPRNPSKISTIRFRRLSETSPETRLHRILQKKKFEEALQFAQLFHLDRELVHVAFMNHLLDQLSPWSAVNFNNKSVSSMTLQLWDCLDNIRECLLVVENCMRAALPSFQDTWRLLTVCQAKVMYQNKGFHLALLDIQNRLLTFKLAFGVNSYSAEKWMRFQQSSLLHEACCHMTAHNAHIAVLIWRRHSVEWASQITSHTLDQLLFAVPERLGGSCVLGWVLEDLIPYVARFLPHSLGQVGQWSIQRATNMEMLEKDGWPRNALSFLGAVYKQMMEIMEVDFSESTHSAAENATKTKIDACRLLGPLRNVLQLLQNLYDLQQYNLRMPLQQFQQETKETLAFRMLDRVVMVELIVPTLERYITPYIQANHLNQDHIFASYVKDLLKRVGHLKSYTGHSAWEEKVLAIISFILDPKKLARLIVQKDREKSLQDALKILKEYNICSADAEADIYFHYAHVLISTERLSEYIKHLRCLSPEMAKRCGMQVVCLAEVYLDQPPPTALKETEQKQQVLLTEAAVLTLKHLITQTKDRVELDELQCQLSIFTALSSLQREYNIYMSVVDYSSDIHRGQIFVKSIQSYLKEGKLLQDNFDFTNIYRLADLLVIRREDFLMEMAVREACDGNIKATECLCRELLRADPSPTVGHALYQVGMNLLQIQRRENKEDEETNFTNKYRYFSHLTQQLATRAVVMCSEELLPSCLELSRAAEFWQRTSAQCEAFETPDMDKIEEAKLKPRTPLQAYKLDTLYEDDALVMSSAVVLPLVSTSLATTVSFIEDDEDGDEEEQQGGSVTRPLQHLLTAVSHLRENSHLELSLRLTSFTFSSLHHMLQQHDMGYPLVPEMQAWLERERAVMQDADVKAGKLIRDLVSGILVKIFSAKSVDCKMALAYLLSVPRKVSISCLNRSISSCGLNFRKLRAIASVGVCLGHLLKETSVIATCQELETGASWGVRLAKAKVDFKEAFKGGVSAKRDIIACLAHCKEASIAMVTEFCHDFKLDLEDGYMVYLEHLLIWPISLGDGDYVSSTSAPHALQLKHAQITVSAIINLQGQNQLLKKLKALYKKASPYDYENIEFLLTEINKLEPTPLYQKGLQLVNYLKVYNRHNPPSDYELSSVVKQKDDAVELGSPVDLLTRWSAERLPVHLLLDGDAWKIITSELQAETVTIWLQIAQLLNLSTDEIYLMTVQNMVKQHVAHIRTSGVCAATNSFPSGASGTQHKKAVPALKDWKCSESSLRFLERVQQLVSSVTNCEMALACASWVVKELPMGGEKVVGLQGCVTFARQWHQACADNSRCCIHMILPSPICCNLGSSPHELLAQLMEHPCLINESGQLGTGPDIYAAIQGIAEINGMDVSIAVVEAMQKWLLSSDSQQDMDTTMNISFSSLKFTDQSDNGRLQDNMKRVKYFLQHGPKKAIIEFLVGYTLMEEAESISYRGRLQCLYCLLQVATDEDLRPLGYTCDTIRELLKVLMYLSHLEQLHIHHSQDTFLECNKTGLVKGIWRNHSHSKPAVLLVASLCLDYGIEDRQMWAAILQQMLSLSMLENLEYILKRLQAMPSVWSLPIFAHAWQAIADFHPWQDCPVSGQLDFILLAHHFQCLGLALCSAACLDMDPLQQDSKFKDILDGNHSELLSDVHHLVELGLNLSTATLMQEKLFEAILQEEDYQSIITTALPEFINFIIKQDNIDGCLLFAASNNMLAQAETLLDLYFQHYPDQKERLVACCNNNESVPDTDLQCGFLVHVQSSVMPDFVCQIKANIVMAISLHSFIVTGNVLTLSDDGGGGRRRGFCRWFNVAKGWGFITPDNGDQDVFVHHSVIHKAGFRNLGKGELVEFESRPSYKCVEATFVCGIGGVNFRGSDRRVISRKKFQNKPVVQLQQQQPQRRQCQAELQRDRFHGWSGRSTCNITNRPVVDDSAVYTVRPLVDALH